MVLEATVIIVDNSEHSRNGDYLPSRFEAQSDTVSLIFHAKTESNPESSVGLMSMGGPQPEVLVTLATDLGKIIDGLHRTKIRGKSNLSTALNVAQLVLKHRQNKSQHQRIIVFTCSPLSEDEKTIIKLAKRLKKNTIAVDVIAFGELDSDTVKKVEAFHENIKGSADGSHLAIIPPGPNLLSDSVLSSSILEGTSMHRGGHGGGDADMGGMNEGGAGGEFGDMGFDPASDPELALALRMSMEEEQRRQAREQEQRDQEANKTTLESVPETQEGGEGSSSGGPSSGGPSTDDKKDKGGEGSMDTS